MRLREAVSLLGCVLFERFVHADVAIRTTVSAGAPPATALALLALVVTLAILMAYTFHALLYTLLAVEVLATPRVRMTRPVQAPCPWSCPHPSVGQVLALRADVPVAQGASTQPSSIRPLPAL